MLPQWSASRSSSTTISRITRTRWRLTACALGICATHLLALGTVAAWMMLASPSPAAVSVGDVPSLPTVGTAVQTTGQVVTRTARSPLAGHTVVIDPGHNGRNWAHPEIINRLVWAGNRRKPCDTAGAATHAGYAESALTWEVSRRLARTLRARGAHVVLTRRTNRGVGPCITERAAIGNEQLASAVVSVHGDGANASGHGFHVIRPVRIRGLTDDIYADSRELAIGVRDALRAAGVPPANYVGTDGIDMRGDLGGLNLSNVPKVFVELGNLRNAGDARRLGRAAHRQRLAVALADSLQAYLTSH